MTTSLLQAAARDVSVPLGSLTLPGTLAWPEHPSGLVIFAQGLGAGARPHRSALIARHLRSAGLATLVVDLLTPREREGPVGGFEGALLAGRLQAATEWVLGQAETSGLVPGYLGLGTGAAAALRAAAAGGALVAGVVTHGGRPDLAGDAIHAVRAPTLLIADSHDQSTLEPCRQAYRSLQCIKRLVVIPGATGATEERGSLEAGQWTAEWFVYHLVLVPRRQAVRGALSR